MRNSILVLDESIFIRNITHHILGVDYNIFLTKNINRARELVDLKEIDLIILDILFKNENSLDQLVAFRNFKSTENLPVIVFTSNTHQSIKNDYYSFGIVNYINKPYNFHDLEKKKIEEKIPGPGTRIKTISEFF